MDVRFYGRLADIIGRVARFDVAEHGCSLGEIRARIAADYPEARDQILSSRVRACVGDTIVADDHRLRASDAVEFFPPVSGG